MSDQELAARYRNGEEGACTALLARYASLINRWIGSWGIPGADREDLRQEACMGLLNAIRTYMILPRTRALRLMPAGVWATV